LSNRASVPTSAWVLRLLHTSDWHLGLELRGHDRLPEQRRFLDWLLDRCALERIDALLVAGDVYDVASPPVAAQAAFAEFLVEFRRSLPGASIVVVAGNHDSAGRLELPRPFAEALGGVHLVGSIGPESEDRHIVPLRDATGAIGAVCVAVPFPRTSDLDCRLQEGETPDQAYARAVDAFYSRLSARAREIHPGVPVVAMGHLTLAGSARAGSERVLIGGLESVPASALSDHADYVALGHIHRAQRAGSEHARYCGSPLAMDFDERSNQHQVLVVDLAGPGEPPTIRPVDVPEFVPLIRLPEKPGSWNLLEQTVRDFDWSPWKDAAAEDRPLVELQFLSDGTESDLRRRTVELCAGMPFRVAGSPRALDFQVTDSSPAENVRRTVDLAAGDAPLELFRSHWSSRFGSSPPDEVESCFREVLDSVRIGRHSS